MLKPDDFRNRVCRSIEASLTVKQRLLASAEVVSTITTVCEIVAGALENGCKLLLFGNGGSAADAQHIAAELVGRFAFDRPALPALALSVNTSCVTAIGNDYGFDKVFSRQIEALGRRGDVAIGISTSGNSPNVLLGLSTARDMGLHAIGLTNQNRRQAEGRSRSLYLCAFRRDSTHSGVPYPHRTCHRGACRAGSISRPERPHDG